MMGLWNVALLAIAMWDLRRLPSAPQLEVTRAWSGILTQGTQGTATLTVRNGGSIPIEAALTDFVRTRACATRRLTPRCASRPDARHAQPTRSVLAIAAICSSVWSRFGGAAIGHSPSDGRRRHSNRRCGSIPTCWSHAANGAIWSGAGRPSMERRRVRRARGGRDFESLRDYQAGDEKRDVCWTASARRGKLVTKVYVPERSQAVWILVDGGRLQRARDGDRSMLDHAVMGALALSQVALASGDRVGLLTYGRRVHRRVAPGRGSTHLRDLVDALVGHPGRQRRGGSRRRRGGDHERAATPGTGRLADRRGGNGGNTRRHRTGERDDVAPCGAVRRHASSSDPRRRQRCTRTLRRRCIG